MAGTSSQTYAGIPAGTVCTATETATGATAALAVTSTGSPQALTIAPNGSGTMNLVNTYQPLPGNVVVTKTVTGAAAGLQSEVGILVTCSGPRVYAVVLPAGAPAGTYQRSIAGLPAGATCTVIEAVNGSNEAVDVSATGNRQQIEVPPAASGTLALINNVEAVAPEPPTPAPPPAPVLPATGAGDSTGGVALVALLIGALGAVLVAVSRRRFRT